MVLGSHRIYIYIYICRTKSVRMGNITQKTPLLINEIIIVHRVYIYIYIVYTCIRRVRTKLSLSIYMYIVYTHHIYIQRI